MFGVDVGLEADLVVFLGNKLFSHPLPLVADFVCWRCIAIAHQPSAGGRFHGYAGLGCFLTSFMVMGSHSACSVFHLFAA